MLLYQPKLLLDLFCFQQLNGAPNNVAHKEPNFYSNTISQHMQTLGKHTNVLWAYVSSNSTSVPLTPQRGVTGTARHRVNITCRGVTSTVRHAARSHSFVYISTTEGASVIRLLRACS